MHTATKVMLILGGVLTVIGIVMWVGGAAALEFDPIGDSEWEGKSGTFDGESDIWYGAYAEASSCDDITYSVTDSDGDEVVTSDEGDWGYVECDDSTYAEDGYIYLGSWDSSIYPAPYSVSSSETIYIADIGEELGEAGGGILAILGSWGLLCCGGFFLLLGGIFALTLKEGGDTVVVVNQAQQPMMATGMAAPQYDQPAQYQAPVQQQYQQPPQGGL